MPDKTLELYSGERLLFASNGRWLHPLFELEEFLHKGDYDAGRLLLKDRIVGKAAAFLIVRLGLRKIRAGILSKLAREVLERHGPRYEYEQLVERILCSTEEMLLPVDDPERAYQLLRERAERSRPERPGQ